MDVDKELKRVSFDIYAFEHFSEKEMKDYLHAHPNADPKDHWVKRRSLGDKAKDVGDRVFQLGEGVQRRFHPEKEHKVFAPIEATPLSPEEESEYHDEIYRDITKELERTLEFDPGFSSAKGLQRLVQRIVGSKILLKEYRDEGHKGLTEDKRKEYSEDVLPKLRVYIQAATKAFRDFADKNPEQFQDLVRMYKEEHQQRPDIFNFDQDSRRVTSPVMR